MTVKKWTRSLSNISFSSIPSISVFLESNKHGHVCRKLCNKHGNVCRKLCNKHSHVCRKLCKLLESNKHGNVCRKLVSHPIYLYNPINTVTLIQIWVVSSTCYTKLPPILSLASPWQLHLTYQIVCCRREVCCGRGQGHLWHY